MPAEPDPFSTVYRALWTLAEQSALLSSLVRPFNRIKFHDESWSDPRKDEVSDADLPELVLAVTQMTAQIRATSSGSYATMNLEWWLSTGDTSVHRTVLPVMWAVFAAMTPWPAIAPTLVSWKDKPFIKKVDLMSANLGLADRERNRGIVGWSAIWGCEVQLGFATRDVIDSNSEV